MTIRHWNFVNKLAAAALGAALVVAASGIDPTRARATEGVGPKDAPMGRVGAMRAAPIFQRMNPAAGSALNRRKPGPSLGRASSAVRLPSAASKAAPQPGQPLDRQAPASERGASAVRGFSGQARELAQALKRPESQSGQGQAALSGFFDREGAKPEPLPVDPRASKMPEPRELFQEAFIAASQVARREGLDMSNVLFRQVQGAVSPKSAYAFEFRIPDYNGKPAHSVVRVTYVLNSLGGVNDKTSLRRGVAGKIAPGARGNYLLIPMYVDGNMRTSLETARKLLRLDAPGFAPKSFAVRMVKEGRTGDADLNYVFRGAQGGTARVNARTGKTSVSVAARAQASLWDRLKAWTGRLLG